MDSRFEVLPRHVGVIMDGNGRWAKKRGLPRGEGHKAGAKVFREITKYARRIGIEYITYYAFSTENWNRPKEEIDGIMELFREYLFESEERLEENEQEGMQVRFIGEKSGLPADIVTLMERAEQETSSATDIVVNLAINYGGQAEIAHSARELAQAVARGEMRPEEITPEKINQHLYTAGQPPLDLVIRPSGEYRLSNFMIWQAAYAEFWYSNVLWPDFTPEDFDRAMFDFAKRNRRFGGV